MAPTPPPPSQAFEFSFTTPSSAPVIEDEEAEKQPHWPRTMPGLAVSPTEFKFNSPKPKFSPPEFNFSPPEFNFSPTEFNFSPRRPKFSPPEFNFKPSDDKPISSAFAPTALARPGSSSGSSPAPFRFGSRSGNPASSPIEPTKPFNVRVLHTWDVSAPPRATSPLPSSPPSPRVPVTPAIPLVTDTETPDSVTTALDQLSLSSPSPTLAWVAMTCLSPAQPVAPKKATQPSVQPKDHDNQTPPMPVTPIQGNATPSSGSQAAHAAYDVRDEQPPTHPLFSAAFQRALKNGASTAKKAANLIETLNAPGTSDDTLARLQREARSLSSLDGAETRTIAVLGDSGEG